MAHFVANGPVTPSPWSTPLTSHIPVSTLKLSMIALNEREKMSIAVRYYSRGGNTKKLAKAVEEAIEIPALSIDEALAEKVDTLLLGCSYYAFDMDQKVKEFITENKDKIGKIVLFGTSAMMKSMKKPLKKQLQNMKVDIEIAEEEFHCAGSFKFMHKGRPNDEDIEAVKAFAKKIAEK